MTILDAAARLRRKEISSVELTKDCLARIDKTQSTLNAFITVTAAVSIEQAKAADEALARGEDRGPLHGIPIALKDVFETKGIRTTCGSLLFANHVPGRSSAVAGKLEAAGAVLLGKTGMHELAYGITSNNPHFGTIRNPANLDCIPGGSSGGSGAAVAADLAFMAMGSDTGGSIRIPAAFCGTVGLKPTFGRVSRYGVLPLDFSLDHMGPLTRSVRDAAAVLQVLAGYDPRDETSSHAPVGNYTPGESPSIRDLRVGIPENFYFERIDPAVAASAQKMIRLAETLGARIVAVRVPDIAALNTIGRVILMVEASATMEPHLTRRDQFGDDVLALFDQGRFLSGTQYLNAQRLRRVMQENFRELFRTVDCLFTPTTPTTAPRIGQATIELAGQAEDARLASTRLVRGINVLGLPALALPSGHNGGGMPVSLQIVGRPFEEDLILRVGAALEDAR